MRNLSERIDALGLSAVRPLAEAVVVAVCSGRPNHVWTVREMSEHLTAGAFDTYLSEAGYKRQNEAHPDSRERRVARMRASLEPERLAEIVDRLAAWPSAEPQPASLPLAWRSQRDQTFSRRTATDLTDRDRAVAIDESLCGEA